MIKSKEWSEKRWHLCYSSKGIACLWVFVISDENKKLSEAWPTFRGDHANQQPKLSSSFEEHKRVTREHLREHLITFNHFHFWALKGLIYHEWIIDGLLWRWRFLPEQSFWMESEFQITLRWNITVMCAATIQKWRNLMSIFSKDNSLSQSILMQLLKKTFTGISQNLTCWAAEKQFGFSRIFLKKLILLSTKDTLNW